MWRSARFLRAVRSSAGGCAAYLWSLSVVIAALNDQRSCDPPRKPGQTDVNGLYIKSVMFSRDGRTLAAGSEGGKVFLCTVR